jgi:hypothetical protein
MTGGGFNHKVDVQPYSNPQVFDRRSSAAKAVWGSISYDI